MKNMALVYRGSSSQNPYIARIRKLYEDCGYVVHEIHWQNKDFSESGDINDHVLRIACKGGLASIRVYPRFALFIRRFRKTEFDFIHVINEDVLVLALIAGIRSVRWILDIRDGVVERIRPRYRISRYIAVIVRKVASCASTLILVPDANRLSLVNDGHSEYMVLENSPALGVPRARHGHTGYQGILFSGSLSLNRGCETLLRVLDSNNKIRCLAAGWFESDSLRQRFESLPNFRFLGALAHDSLLDVAADLDGIFAFYAPVSVNNINASPSKLYDAMRVGVPLIINSEVKISEWIERSGFGFRCKYQDWQELERIIVNLRNTSFSGEAVKRSFAEEHCWEIMSSRFRNAIERLSS
jgi:hypothetical protein